MSKKRTNKSLKSVKSKEDISKLVPEEKFVYHLNNGAKISILDKLYEEHSDIDLNFLVFPPGITDEEIENNINLRAQNSLVTLSLRLDNIDALKWLIKKGADKFILIEGNKTVFHLAAEKNSFECMKILLDGETDLDLMELEDDEGLTPFLISLEKFYNSQICSLCLEKGTLFSFSQTTRRIQGRRMLLHEVVLDGKIKFIECLINLGESLFKRDAFSNNLLHTLFRSDGPTDVKIVRSILDLFVKKFVKIPQNILNAENHYGKTPLEMCLFDREFFDIAKYLIKLGCNINHISKISGMTIMHKCVCMGNEKVLLELFGPSFKIKCNMNDRWGNHPIHYCNKEKMLKIIIEKKSDVNWQNYIGISCLHRFIIMGNVELVNVLLNEKKINLKIKTKKLQNVLHLCAKYGRYEIYECLIKKLSSSMLKGMIEEECIDGNTPLEVAINEKKEKIGLKLIDKNANILRNNKNLIYLAAKLGLSKIVLEMIEKERPKNAEIVDKLINEFDEKQRTALHVAVMNNDKHSVKALLSSPNCLIDIVEKENKETPLMISCKNGFDEIALILLKKKASTNFADDEGRIALHYAARSKNVKVSKILIENGSHVNKEDKYGRTPLHEASGSNNAIVVSYLIKNDANIEFKDGKGRTPLHIAVLNGALLATKVLVESGAEMNSVDNYGLTPLLISSKTNNTDCGRIIVQAFAELKRLGKI